MFLLLGWSGPVHGILLELQLICSALGSPLGASLSTIGLILLGNGVPVRAFATRSGRHCRLNPNGCQGYDVSVRRLCFAVRLR